MEEIYGKWIQLEDQPYPGLWFEFDKNQRFEARYDAMGIVSSGHYEIDTNKIDIYQTEHTLGFTGHFKGLFNIEDDRLFLALPAGPGQPRPADLSEARIYKKHNSDQR